MTNAVVNNPNVVPTIRWNDSSSSVGGRAQSVEGRMAGAEAVNADNVAPRTPASLGSNLRTVAEHTGYYVLGFVPFAVTGGAVLAKQAVDVACDVLAGESFLASAYENGMDAATYALPTFLAGAVLAYPVGRGTASLMTSAYKTLMPESMQHALSDLSSQLPTAGAALAGSAYKAAGNLHKDVPRVLAQGARFTAGLSDAGTKELMKEIKGAQTDSRVKALSEPETVSTRGGRGRRT